MDWQIISTYIPIIIIAFFGIIEIWKGIDYLIGKHKKKVDEAVKDHKEGYDEEQRFQCLEDEITTLKENDDRLQNNLNACQKQNEARFNQIEDKIDKLMASDIAAIKSWVSRMHCELKKQGWVSKYDLESVESRYAIYKEEGGNSFVEDLVEEIRKLPKK